MRFPKMPSGSALLSGNALPRSIDDVSSCIIDQEVHLRLMMLAAWRQRLFLCQVEGELVACFELHQTPNSPSSLWFGSLLSLDTETNMS